MTKNNRETWLNQLAEMMAPRFAELGYPLPPFRVSVGFPSAGMKSRAIGECWDKSASGDKHFEIFLRPDRSDSMDVAATLAHELAHTAVGLDQGHTGNFARVALALGLRRLFATTAGPAFIAWVEPMLERLGRIPHAPLSWRTGGGVTRGGGGILPKPPRDDSGASDADGEHDDDVPQSSAPPKQTTRLRKACCADCGYTVRVTSKWLEIGPPHCPVHGAMAVDVE